jgi:hypothetical protein
MITENPDETLRTASRTARPYERWILFSGLFDDRERGRIFMRRLITIRNCISATLIPEVVREREFCWIFMATHGQSNI